MLNKIFAKHSATLTETEDFTELTKWKKFIKHENGKPITRDGY